MTPLEHANNFRARLLELAGVPPAERAENKQSCYELVTHALALDTRHHPHVALLQSACQVIDDFVLAVTPP